MRLFEQSLAGGWVKRWIVTCGLTLSVGAVWSQSGSDPALAQGGPIRIYQTQQDSAPTQKATEPGKSDAGGDRAPTQRPGSQRSGSQGNAAEIEAPPPPGEFETFAKLPRFGTDLVNELASGAVDFSPVVPPEYVIQVGDELQVTFWGALDADLRLTVDRAGRVSIPRVGAIAVAGVRYSDLRDVLTRRVGSVFKNFELNATLGKLRGVRIYVTGFVRRPGAYSVAGLSTVMNAVMRAGGPSTAGSFRQIDLRRGGRVVSQFDLYDLLLRGDRSGDQLVQPDDVIHIGPVGSLVGLRGSVNRQAIFELKPSDTLGDLLRMGGGFSPVADRTRLTIERLENRNAQRIVQLQLPQADGTPLLSGDLVSAFSAVEATLSVQRQNKRVRIDGEVMTPGEYVMPSNSTIADALRAAGGITNSAFIFGTQFTRTSVLTAQQENYARALRDLETDLARANASQRVSTSEDAATASARSASNARLLDRLRALQPTGRVVLQLQPDATGLPELALEDGDRLYIPAQPSTVGVFGSVFNTGSYLYNPNRALDDYLRLAGGPTKGADQSSAFVVRANGQVISSRQNDRWFTRGARFGQLPAVAGDTVFVPEEMDTTTFLQAAKDWTQVLYQLGLGAAGLSLLR